MKTTFEPRGGSFRNFEPVCTKPAQSKATTASEPRTLTEYLISSDRSNVLGNIAKWFEDSLAGKGSAAQLRDSLSSVRLSDYERRRTRAVRVLGSAGSREAAQRVSFSLSAKRVDSREVIAAIEALDLSPLTDAGVEPVACVDFDNTLMSGDVLFAFIRYAAARGEFPRDALPGVVHELKKRRPDLATRDIIRTMDVNEVLEYLVRKFESGDLHGADIYNIAMRAFRGMEHSDIARIGKVLFEEGLPGEGPYWKNAYDPDPGPGDSARELVDALRAKGIRVVIVTAGLVDLARVGAKFFGVEGDDVIGAELETDANGVLTGNAEDVGIIGKDALIRERLGHPPLFAFGDSWRTDGHMLPLALIQGFIVGDDPYFDEKAREAGHDFTTMVFEPAP